MIKVETLGMLDRVAVNPVIKSQNTVKNYDFITDNDELYLVTNTITGDDAYKEDVSFAPGEYLNGYLVKSLVGQKLVIDGKHIAYGDGDDYDDLEVGDFLEVGDEGKLEVADEEPTGVYLEITDIGVRLTEAAVKAVVRTGE